MENEKAIIPAHQWANEDGEVLILRFADMNRESRGGFQFPMKVGETVTAPDWAPYSNCGGGIHGWPLGLSIGSGKGPDWSALWQVYGVLPADIIGNIEGEGKCKFRTGTLRFLGDWQGAISFVLGDQIKWVRQAANGAASSTGYNGVASSTRFGGAASSTGDRGVASSTDDRGVASSTGDRGVASSTGDNGVASSTGARGVASSTGYNGVASSTGERGAASSTGRDGAASSTGDWGTASVTADWGVASSTGDNSVASSTGINGAASSTGDNGAAMATCLGSKARGGKFGCIALAWWNSAEGRVEMRCALTGNGDNSLKAGVWYTLNEEGKFVEVA
jgi:hypothetical protein